MTVITRKEIWMNPSCMDMGTPTRRIFRRMSPQGFRSARVSGIPRSYFRTIHTEMPTLMAWLRDRPQGRPWLAPYGTLP